MQEIWKDIPGYEEKYQISNLGNIRSKKNHKILKSQINKKNGYVYFNMYKNKKYKNVRVHRLVAEVFLKNEYNKPFVNHKDGNKINNKIDNLEWCTQKENVNHAIEVLKVDYSKGIDIMQEKNQRKVIRSDGKIYESIKNAKKDIKNKNAHIVEVCQGKLKTACGYGWQYYEG